MFEIENGVLKRYTGKAAHVVVPDGVREIGQAVFMEMSRIKSVTLPEGLVRIGSSAFHSCTALQSIRIPESVEEIGEAAFIYCADLRGIAIPQGVRIGQKAFRKCTCLADPEGFVIVNQVLYDYAGPGGFITLPDGVRCISEEAFRENNTISRVILPSSVERIEDMAFYGCNKLREIHFNEGLRKIGNLAFSLCPRLQYAPVPESLEFLDANAFFNCRSLADEEGFVIIGGQLQGYAGKEKTVRVPNTVHTIGETVFSRYSTVRELFLPNSVTHICKWAFWESKLTRLNIPVGVTNLEEVWPDVLWHCKLEILRAPGRSLKSLKPHHSAAAVGYAEMVSEGQVFPEELEQEYCAYIKSQRKRLYPTAVRHPELLRYMIDRRLIPREDLDRLLELAEDNGEIRAMILQYSGSLASQKATAHRGPRL